MNRDRNADPVTDLAQALHEAGEELRRLEADAAADRCTAVLARWTRDAAGGGGAPYRPVEGPRPLDLVDALGMAAHRLDGAAGLAECVAAAPFVPDADALEALAEAARHGAEEARAVLDRWDPS